MTLVLEDVHASMRKRPVLQGVDLRAGPGEVVAVVGPNGAGKSTLLRVAAGLLRPTRGRIRWDDQDLLALRPAQRARLVGLVPQSAHLDHPFTVREVVAMGRYAYAGPLGRARAGDQDHVTDALRRTALVDLAGRPVTELSGGERQRVLLARVLAQDPRLYLFDEPTANLDLGQAAAVEATVRALAGDGRAVVIVMHDLASAARLADRLVLLGGGRVRAAGAARDVLTPEHLEATFDVRVEVAWDDRGRPHLETRS